MNIPDNLPPHDPARTEAVDGYEDESCTNGLRSQMAVDAILTRFHEGDENGVSDLICNLLHLAHSLGMDPGGIMETAANNFVCEAGGLTDDPA